MQFEIDKKGKKPPDTSRALIEAVTSIRYWMYRPCFMMPVCSIVVLVTSAMSIAVWITKRGAVIY